MQDGKASFGARAGRALTKVVIFTIIIALLGAVGVLMSQLNARTYRLVASEGHLIVMKGRMFPIGSLPYRPSDPLLTDAYAPIQLLEPAPPDLLNRTYSEREELDRALFVILERMSAPRVRSSHPAEVEQGLYFLQRAERLSGLTEDQRSTLKKLQADVAFYKARAKLDEARRLVADALSQLRLATERGGQNVNEARKAPSQTETIARILEEALGGPLTSRREPPPPSTSPAPAPAPAEPAQSPTDGGAPSPAFGSEGVVPLSP